MSYASPRGARVLVRLLAFLFSLVPAAAHAQLVTASGPGTSPAVRVIEVNGTERTFLAYHPAFGGGVRIALGDVNGDGVLDIVTAPGPGGGPHVRVWNGVDHSEIGGFFAYDPAFPGGVFVAAGDVDGDGRADIITGAGAGGGPHVRVWSGADFTEIAGFFAYHPAFPGGVRVAAGDVDGDGRADVITGAGPGGGPYVRVWNVNGFAEIGGFFAYDPAFPGGVNVAAGDVDGDGRADVITGAGPGGGPHVRVWSLNGFAEIGGFFAYDPGFPGGIEVGAIDLTSDGRVEIVTGIGPGGLPIASIWSGLDLSLMGSYYAFDPAFPAGVFIGSAGQHSLLRFTSASAASFPAGTASAFTVTTLGGATPPALTMAGTLPSGVTFVDNGNRTATLAGTPGPGTAGSYPLTFAAANGSTPAVTQTFTLIVTQAPAITSANGTTFNVGTPGTFTITTTGSPAPAIAATGALPTGITLTDNGNGTATLAGTAAPGTNSTYSLVITASNGVGSAATQNFTLSVTAGPVFTSAAATTFTAGAPGAFTVTTTGSPVAALVVSGSLPSGVTFADNGNGTGTLSGTPAPGSSGVYAISFTAANGVLPNGTQNFTLTVSAAPVVTSANSAAFAVGTPGSFTVTTTGFPAPSLVRGGAALPAGITFVDNGNGTGTLSGTAAPGTGGVYAISFTATNIAGSSTPQVFTLSISQGPLFTSAAEVSFTVGQSGSFTVTTSASPAASIARSGAALPAGITFVDNGDGTGTLSGTAAPGTGGAYALTFTAANGVLPDAVQSFVLRINTPPAITSANGTTLVVGAPSSFTVTTSGFPTPTVAHSSGVLPAGVSFTAATRVLGGAATQTGSFPLQFTAANGVAPDAVQAFTLTVACPAITVTPTVMPDGIYQAAYTGVDFNQTGSTGSAFTWGATGLPAGLTINVNTGVVSGTPTDTGLAAAVTVTVTDNFGCQGTRSTTITVRPSVDDESYGGGVGNTQYVVGAAVLSTPHVFIADNVKNGDSGPGTLSVTFGPAVNGTVSEGPADGTFTYTPNVNFAGPTDTFTYQLTDGNGVTNTATVTINLGIRVWYVNSAGGNGDGRSHLPFNTLTSAQTASSPGDVIYVHGGGGPTSGNITLKAGQTLWGGGHTLTMHLLTIPAGTTPVLAGGVTLANDVLVRALDINTNYPTAIAGGNLTGTQTIDSVNILGATTGLYLTNIGGSLTFTGSIGVSAPAVAISGGNGAISIGGPVTTTSNVSILVGSKTGGSVTFSGAVASSGQVLLTNNTGATIAFNGGLTLNTGTNPAFTATGGGTVTVTGAANTLTTTTGAPLNVANTTIGAAGLTFRSISASGAANGIALSNTGVTGGLTVTGSGTAGSGGTLANISNRGASFINASNIALTNMNFTNTATLDLDADNSGLTLGDNLVTNAAIHLQSVSGVTFNGLAINGSAEQGINGNTVSNFSLLNSSITNTGDGADEDGLHFYNLLGTNFITNTSISSSGDDNVNIQNQSGTTAITVTGGSFSAGVRGSGYLMGIRGTSNTTVTLTGVTASNNFSGGIAIDTFDTATSAIDISGGTITNNNGGIAISSDNGSTRFDIHDNLSFTGNASARIGIVKSAFSTSGTLQGFIRNNPIAVANGQNADGIVINAAGGGNLTVAVTGNTIAYAGTQRAILVQGGQDGNAAINYTMTANLIDLQLDEVGDAVTGVLAQTAVTGPGNTSSMCAAIGGAGGLSNTFTYSLGGSPAGGDIRIRQRNSGTISLPGYAGGATDTAAVAAYLGARNTLVIAATATADSSGFAFSAGCQTPNFP